MPRVHVRLLRLLAILTRVLHGFYPADALVAVVASDGVGAHADVPIQHGSSVDGDRYTGPLQTSETTSAATSGCCFSESCPSWSLDVDGHTIIGDCWNKEDQRHWVKIQSSLDLDLCLLNTNGKLVPFYEGDFHETCTNCALQGTLLLCNCKSLGGSDAQKARIDLDKVITQSKGVLKCFDHGGRLDAI